MELLKEPNHLHFKVQNKYGEWVWKSAYAMNRYADLWAQWYQQERRLFKEKHGLSDEELICNMNLAKEYVYLIFDIQNRYIQIVGKVQILIHKETEIEKWKNPDLLSQQAIDLFKSENPKYKDEMLSAFYTSDLIPTI